MSNFSLNILSSGGVRFHDFYRAQTKLREGNVFTRVCHSVRGGGMLSLPF